MTGIRVTVAGSDTLAKSKREQGVFGCTLRRLAEITGKDVSEL